MVENLKKSEGMQQKYKYWLWNHVQTFVLLNKKTFLFFQVIIFKAGMLYDINVYCTCSSNESKRLR